MDSHSRGDSQCVSAEGAVIRVLEGTQKRPPFSVPDASRVSLTIMSLASGVCLLLMITQSFSHSRVSHIRDHRDQGAPGTRAQLHMVRVGVREH